MLKIVCDRCGSERPVKIGAHANEYPQAMAGSAHAYPILEDWTEHRGKHLCAGCTRQLDRFLERLPQAG